MFSADYFDPGLELAVKSLRSSGSQARIVVFSSNKYYEPPRVVDLFKKLKVERYTNYTETKNRSYVPHMLRFEHERDWLRQHISEVDRAFHADAFDVFFQADPFSNEIIHDELLFILEPHPIRGCSWNSHWISSCYDKEIQEHMSTQLIICSGSIIGGSVPYLQFLELLTSQQEWSQCYDRSLDQAHVNVLVWTGKVRDAGIKYKFTGCAGNYMTMKWCLEDNEIKTNSLNQVLAPQGNIPAFYHQYNRIEWFACQLYDQCHVTPHLTKYNLSA